MHLSTPPSEQDETQGQFLSASEKVRIQSSFSKTGCHTKIKDHSLPYDLQIAGVSILGFIHFQILALFENANSLAKDSTSDHRVHFKRLLP